MHACSYTIEFNALHGLHYTHYTTLHYTTLHYTTLHYTTLHYTTRSYYIPVAHFIHEAMQLSRIQLESRTNHRLSRSSVSIRSQTSLYTNKRVLIRNIVRRSCSFAWSSKLFSNRSVSTSTRREPPPIP